MRIGISLLLILFLSGCNPKNGSRTLRVQLSSEPVSLDPALAEDGVSLRILNNLMDGLVGLDAAGQWTSRLAERVESLEKGRKWRFKIRKATWSDGMPIDASQFVEGFRRSFLPGVPAKLVSGLYGIRGARSSAVRLGVVAIDPQTLEIELDHPNPKFVQRLGMSAAYPVRPEWPEPEVGKEWSWVGRPTTGPYVLEAHRRDVEYQLRANVNYYGGAPAIERVLLKVVNEDVAALNVFEQGGLDILTRIPTLDYERLRDLGLLQTDPFLATFYLGFNTRLPPFDQVRMRRAVAQSIHREDLVAALGMGERAARSWVPPELLAPQATKSKVSDDRAWARAQIEKLPKARREIRVTTDSGARNLMVLEKVQADLRQELGLSVRILARDWKSHIRGLQTDPGAMYRFAWLAPYPDPLTHLQVFGSRSPNNYTGWNSPIFDALLEQAESLPEGAERNAVLHRAENLLLEEAVVLVPLYQYVQVHAIAHRVVGFKVNPLGVIRFDDLRLD